MDYTYAAVGRLSEGARHAAFLREMGPDVPYTPQLLALLDGLEGRKQAARARLTPIDATPLDAHNKSEDEGAPCSKPPGDDAARQHE